MCFLLSVLFITTVVILCALPVDLLCLNVSEHKSWFDQAQQNCPSFTAPVFRYEFNVAATLQQGDIITRTRVRTLYLTACCSSFHLWLCTCSMDTSDFTHKHIHLGWIQSYHHQESVLTSENALMSLWKIAILVLAMWPVHTDNMI